MIMANNKVKFLAIGSAGIILAMLLAFILLLKADNSYHFSSVASETPEELIQQSKAVIIGKVVSISKPKFSSQDDSWYPTAMIFKEVTVRVNRKLFDELSLGNEIIVTVQGGQKRVPLEVALAKGWPPGTMMAYGEEVPLSLGEDVLLFLEKRPLEFKEGPQSRVVIRGGSQGNYRIEGTKAIHEQADRSLDLKTIEELVTLRKINGNQ